MTHEENNQGDGALTAYVIQLQEATLNRLAEVKQTLNDRLEGVWVLVSYPHSTKQRVGIITRVDLFHGEFVYLVDLVHWRSKHRADYPRDPDTGRYKRLRMLKSGAHFRQRHVKFLDRDRALPGADFERRWS